MVRSSAAVPVLAALLLVACSASDSPTGPAASQPEGLRTAAVAENTRQRIDVVHFGASGCSGDTFYVTGTIFYVTQVTMNRNRGKVTAHLNYANFKGTASDGTEYVVTAAVNQSMTYDITDSAPATSTHAQHVNLISRGDKENLNITIVVHMTYNASGVVTADVSNIVARCTG